jgi:hypothetical protein
MHLQGCAGLRRERWDCLGDSETSINSSLRVVLVRLRIPEISEHAVAHILGHEATIALDQFGAGALIGADDSA